MENKIIILSGPSASGKSTTAKIIRELIGEKIYSIRDHYNNFLVPEYFMATGRNEKISRALHIEIADWMYSKDPSSHAKKFLRDNSITSDDNNVILESFRIKGDLEYFLSKYSSAKFIHIYADFETRLSRKLLLKDELYSKNIDEVRQMLIFEWDHFKLGETMDYMKKIGALMIDTTASKIDYPDELLSELTDYIYR